MESDKLMLFVAFAIGFAAVTAVVEKYWLRFGWLVIPVVLIIIVVVWGARDSAFECWRRRRSTEGEKGQGANTSLPQRKPKTPSPLSAGSAAERAETRTSLGLSAQDPTRTTRNGPLAGPAGSWEVLF